MEKFKLIIILFVLVSQNSLACKCSWPNSVEAEFKSSEIILLGIVEKIEFVGFGETMHPDSLEIARKLMPERLIHFLDGPGILKATLKVKKILKGYIENESIVIYTGFNGASCGYRFKKGKEYVVYGQDYSYLYSFLNIDNDRVQGFRKDDTYWTNHCRRTTDFVKEELELITEHLMKK
jgi:hypothetical protein